MTNRYKTITKTILGGLLLGFMIATPAKSQFTDIGAFLDAGAEDASILTKEYLKPFPTGFGTGLNAGFTESASPKKLFGFSLQIRPSVAVVPSSAQSFDVSQLGLQKIRVASGENPIAQTISGSKGSGPLLEIFDDPNDPNRNKLGEINMPGGTGFSFVPTPIVQASIGLIKKTDVTVRYLPETGISDFGDISILGGAIKHELGQYIPGGKLLPVDISLMVGFNQISINGNLDVPRGNRTRDTTDPTLVSNPNPNFDDQQVKTTTNTFVVNALVGKTLPFISVYGGLGFQNASFDLKVNGDYPVDSFDPNNPLTSSYRVVTDPFGYEQSSESNIHMLGGFRLKLGFLAFYGEATLANYFTANAGVGISFR